MGTKERRAREKENLRQEILDAARELFVTEGYENVSMRKIAEKIEYSPTTIYLYFKDKAELLVQLCEETFAQLATTLEAIQQKYPDPLIGLREGCRAYVRFGLKHPHHYQIVFMTPLPAKIDDQEYAFEGSMGERAFNFMRESVSRCVAAKVLRDVDVEMTSQALWAGMHGVTSLLIAHQDFPWVARDRLIDHLIDTLLEGLKSQPQQKP